MEMWEEKDDFFLKKKGSYVVLQEKWILEECKGSFMKRGCGKL